MKFQDIIQSGIPEMVRTSSDKGSQFKEKEALRVAFLIHNIMNQPVKFDLTRDMVSNGT